MLTTLRHRAAAAGTGCASVSIEELNVVLDQHQQELAAVRGLLREATKKCKAGDKDYFVWYPHLLTDEWFERAEKAGGGE